MAAAPVGDDQFGEDATVNRLQESAARLLGKEAALLVLSGTMANLVAVLAYSNRGDEVVVDRLSHVYHSELGGVASVAGLLVRPVSVHEGYDATALELAIQPGSTRLRNRTAVIVIENPSNRGGGRIVPLERLREMADIGRRTGVPIHMDGARIFNAAVALDVPPVEIARHASSVQFCLTKGLSAPVGSLLCGSAEFIDRARRYRQLIGGGMRQAGVFAAAGLVALESMVERLVEDNVSARALAMSLAAIPSIRIDLADVETNIVTVWVGDLGVGADHVSARLREQGVLALAQTPQTVRFVTHRGIGEAEVQRAADVFGAVAADLTGRRHPPVAVLAPRSR
jgi:threonine aldolase